MWLGKVPVEELCHLYEKQIGPGSDAITALGLFVLYGSWNMSQNRTDAVYKDLLEKIVEKCGGAELANIQRFTGVVQADASDDSLRLCVGDDEAMAHRLVSPCPPESLPTLVVVAESSRNQHAVLEFVTDIPATKLHNNKSSWDFESWRDTLQRHVESVLFRVKHPRNELLSSMPSEAIRIFVAGDRSQVGKSSMCLGILGSLVGMGHDPASLAYIKPATQSESPQLVEKYCERVGISCVAVGPIVYYRGFTRAFLAGETESSEKLLQKAADAVDELAEGKQIVVIDGVGFPSVGSICGTDNAAVATACGYPTADGGRRPAGALLVGPSGVGAAVDSFNLNATYFTSNQVPVLGAIFNKLSPEGFYSLENCRTQVTAYFDRTSTSGRPFGFVPLMPEIAGDAAMDHVDEFLFSFQTHVDVRGIVDAASRLASASLAKRDTGIVATEKLPPTKRAKYASTPKSGQALSRQEIEERAISAGAALSA